MKWGFKYLTVLFITFVSLINVQAESSSSQKCENLFENYVFSELIGDGKYSKKLRDWWWIPEKVFNNKQIDCLDWAKKSHHRNRSELFEQERDCNLVIDYSKKLKKGFSCDQIIYRYPLSNPELITYAEYRYRLKLNNKSTIEIPFKWLITEEELIQENDNYASSFNYMKEIEPFMVTGQRFAGLHLASYESMIPGSGSAMAASGRDVFLLLDTFTGKLSPALITLGETKGRVISNGCFFAKNSRFFIHDINQDGHTDIGVTREEIKCDFDDTEKAGVEYDLMSAPYYLKQARQWYIFDPQQRKWIYNPSLQNKHGQHERKLRYLEIDDNSPVDDVIALLNGKINGLGGYKKH